MGWRPRKLGLALVAALLAVSTMVAVDGAVAQTASGSANGCTTSRVGGEITSAQLSLQGTLDPAAAITPLRATSGAPMFAAVYDVLLRYDPKSGVTPWLAADFSHNAGLTQYTLKLRPGVKFGDGNAFDAAAVVAAQQRYLAGSYKGYAPYISSLTAVNPTTVRYDLTAPWSGLPILLTQGFGMIADPAVAARLGTSFGKTTSTGAGAGPFEVVSYNPPSSVVLKAKSDYWGGPVCIQQLTFTTEASPQQGVDSFLTGQYATAFIRDPVQLARWENTKPRVGTAARTLAIGASTIYINSASKTAHLDDVRVRQALAYANDVNAINQRGFQGAQQAYSGIVPPGLGVLKPTKGVPYDLAKAKKLLDQVKAETGWDGSMRLTCASQSADYATAAAAVFDAAGFKIQADSSLAVTPWTTKVITNQDFDLACAALSVYNGDYWDSLALRVYNTPNHTNFHSPEMDAAMVKLNQTPLGSSAYQSVINQIQKIMNEQVPMIPQGSYDEVTLIQNDLKGVVVTTSGTTLFGSAYLTKK
jgi:peptide/nickel transport system substrate-binding protein